MGSLGPSGFIIVCWLFVGEVEGVGDSVFLALVVINESNDGTGYRLRINLPTLSGPWIRLLHDATGQG